MYACLYCVHVVASRKRCPRAKLFTEFWTLLFTCRSSIPWKNQFQGKWKIIVQLNVVWKWNERVFFFFSLLLLCLCCCCVFQKRGFRRCEWVSVYVQIYGWAYIILNCCCLLELLLCVVFLALHVFPKTWCNGFKLRLTRFILMHNNKQRFYLFKWHFSFIK